jgi:hypothetical protein
MDGAVFPVKKVAVEPTHPVRRRIIVPEYSGLQMKSKTSPVANTGFECILNNS